MNNFGTAVTGGGGASDFAFDTDLGRAVNPQSIQIQNNNRLDAVGSLDPVTTPGAGYTIGTGIEVEQIATTGSGTGFKGIATVIPGAGNLRVGRSLPNTGSFDNSQNQIPKGYAQTGAGGKLSQTSAAVVGTSGTGAAGTFLVTATQGTITKVVVEAAGSGYVDGDIITVTKANLEAAFGGGATVEYDLLIGPVTNADVTGKLESVEISHRGTLATVGDDITLGEVGSSITGTGVVTVASLSGNGDAFGTNPMKSYPTGIRIAEGTVAAPKAIAFQGIDGVNVVVGGFVAGQVLPLQFKQILSAGTTATLGLITIFYGGTNN